MGLWLRQLWTRATGHAAENNIKHTHTAWGDLGEVLIKGKDGPAKYTYNVGVYVGRYR